MQPSSSERTRTAQRRPLEILRGLGVAHVASLLGHEVHGRYIRPCPACGATSCHPNRSDPRGAVGITADGSGWRCFIEACGASGDAAHFAELAIFGEALGPGDPKWAEFFGHAERMLGSPGAAAPRPGSAPQSRPARPKHPAREEVLELLYRDAILPEDDPEVRGWLAAQGISTELALDLDLRVLPAGVETRAPWAHLDGQDWSVGGHRILLRGYRADSELVSVFALHPTPGVDVPPVVAPAGFPTRGIVLANDAGRRMLKGADWAGPALILEGAVEWLRAAAVATDEVAVLGVVPGAASWTDDMATRVRAGTMVSISAPMYANRIKASLARRRLAQGLSSDGT